MVVPEGTSFYKGWGGALAGYFRSTCDKIYTYLKNPENPECIVCKKPTWVADFCVAYKYYGIEEDGVTMSFKLKRGITLVNVMDPHNVKQFSSIINTRIAEAKSEEARNEAKEVLAAMMRFYNPTGRNKVGPRRDQRLELIEQEFGQQDAYGRFSSREDDKKVLNFLKEAYSGAGIRGYYAPTYRMSNTKFFHREVGLFDSTDLMIDKLNPLNTCEYNAGGSKLKTKSRRYALQKKSRKRTRTGRRNTT